MRKGYGGRRGKLHGWQAIVFTSDTYLKGNSTTGIGEEWD
jgi:hypothetical protein